MVCGHKDNKICSSPTQNLDLVLGPDEDWIRDLYHGLTILVSVKLLNNEHQTK